MMRGFDPLTDQSEGGLYDQAFDDPYFLRVITHARGG